jgi:TPR repeat protein
MRTGFAIAAVFVGTLAQGAAPARASGDLEDALRLYENGSYVAAESQFRTLAAGGDARAAEIIGFMYALGPALYPGVPRSLPLAIQWFDAAARGGRPVGRYMACALQRQAGVRYPAPPHCFDWIAETGHPRLQP